MVNKEKLDELKKLLPIFKRIDVITIFLIFVILVAINVLNMFAEFLPFEHLMTLSMLLLLLAMSIFLFHEIFQTFETQESLSSLKSEIKTSLAEHGELWEKKFHHYLETSQKELQTFLTRTKLPFLTHTQKDLYKLGEDIASSAKSKVVLLARSLILVTGPRPYLYYTPHDYEKSHYNCLEGLVQKANEGKIKFSCGYLIPTTKKELNDYPEIKERAKKSLKKLYEASNANNPQSHFVLATPNPRWEPLITFIVGDDRFAIWFKDTPSSDNYFCISAEDNTFAIALIHIFESECNQKKLETLSEELKL